MTEDLDLSGFLLNEKPCRLLVAVGKRSEPFGKEISKEIDSTYSHTLRTVDRFEELGLISRERRGRKMVLSLTEDGEAVADALENLFGAIRETGGDM